jgi:antitoxin HicB
MIYPARFQQEPEGGYTITFRDVPEGISHGETIKHALRMAEDALVTALSFYADHAEPFPAPSAPRSGEYSIKVPALIQAKLALIARIAETRVSNVALAEQLGIDEKAVRRLLNLNHESKISKIEAALAALGKRLEVTVGEAA